MAIDKIRQFYNEMFQAEKKVADYVLENQGQAVNMSIAELAKASGTSDATIIRMCRHIGYSGFYQMKISLASDLGKVSARDEVNGERGPQDSVSFFNMLSKNIADVSRSIDTESLLTCARLITKANTVYMSAWGNTGEIAADFAHRLARSGIKSFMSDMPEYAMRSLGLGDSADVLVAISHSGSSIHVIQAMKLAKELGIPTILITNTPQSEAEKLADHLLCTSVKEQPFHDFGGDSHLLELAVVDALLYFAGRKGGKSGKGDKTEMLMSDSKL
ncbi:MurR/RpiR family transcriptional regulator [Fusibacillus kribbianus]|uniref:MurR/RpiR family transcriptional regulator n=1 Tax=Fusibacillus kribbianus TaxID=3044208 RepID=A0AAP4B8Y4_9FIRM|nr:MurR/RpiR family transcriptional regulator [Ruminococcus sp. YH-rum2234]MDI9240997.1 MurR/RpiR family transcriptional regulator [Ruminococcus sp. YH-rum2234]